MWTIYHKKKTLKPGVKVWVKELCLGAIYNFNTEIFQIDIKSSAFH